MYKMSLWIKFWKFPCLHRQARKPGQDRCICEQFAYTSYLVAYPNSSDMNELDEILLGVYHREVRVYELTNTICASV